MIIIHKEDIKIERIIEEKSFDYSEILDCSRFFLPAECYASEKKIPW
ncbi:MAG: hypothetical protein ACTSQJ_03080 [Promethearchaeota archaeon]